MTAVALRPGAVLFDWDNTLVDSWETIHEALNVVMAAMGKPLWSLAETRKSVRLSLRESFPLHFGERWIEAREIYLDAFGAIHLERLKPLPGRDDLLARLAGKGVFLGVVSNKTGPILRREVTALGWTDFFGSVIGAGDALADKPDPAPVKLALQQSGVALGERVWFVGDTGIDVQCANNSGCVAILLGAGSAEIEAFDCRPRHVCADAEALSRLFEGL